MATAPVIDVAKPDQSNAVYGTLAAAFVADPVFRWIFPRAQDYFTHFAALMETFGGLAFEHGTAFRAADDAGAALWLPAGVHASDEELAANWLSRMAPDQIERVGALMGSVGDYHPSGDHWYLPTIGVDPAHQGRGVGSALLRSTLERCDALGLPAHLESSNRANLPLYQRFGFEIVGELQAGDSPPLWPMTRPAQ
ncbi:MAG: N-acetyltransferase [Myxococcota bacterium]